MAVNGLMDRPRTAFASTGIFTSSPGRSTTLITRRIYRQRVLCTSQVAVAGVSTVAAFTSDCTLPPPRLLSHDTVEKVPALKEWAVTCAALSTGSQTVVLRKGGISEKGFTIPAARFLLFPTSFHSGSSLIQPGAASKFAQELKFEPKKEPILRIDTIARISGAWTTSDPEVVKALAAFHIWTPDYLVKRLRWRQQQPITVLRLRCRKLQQPLEFRNLPELWGCFSWVSIPSRIGIDALWQSGTPVLSDSHDVSQQLELLGALDQLEGVSEIDVG